MMKKSKTLIMALIVAVITAISFTIGFCAGKSHVIYTQEIYADNSGHDYDFISVIDGETHYYFE